MNSILTEYKKLVCEKIEFGKELSDIEIKEIIEAIIFDKSKESHMGLYEKDVLIEELFNSMRRLDVLQPLIDNNEISEIMVNGSNNIFIEKRGIVSKVDTTFESEQVLENIIQSIVSKINRNVNEASPIVDARLSDGSRVNVVLRPIALNGPILTIRKFPENPFTLEDLVNINAISEEAVKFLEILVKAKYNIFISGGTGSGKTTFLNALSSKIPEDERIITIEDSAELKIKNIKNLVSLETRNSNIEGKGEITIRDLIKTSLRMRPDRIIVGEVRGAEAVDMLSAMNTGHDGSISTGHGNSTGDMLSRLETMVLCGANLPLEAIRQQIASAIDIIVHLSRFRDKSRKVVEITELSGYVDGKIILNPIFTFSEVNEIDGKIIGSLNRTENRLLNCQKLLMAGLKV